MKPPIEFRPKAKPHRDIEESVTKIAARIAAAEIEKFKAAERAKVLARVRKCRAKKKSKQ